MIRDLARKLLGPRAVELHLRNAGNAAIDVADCHRRETVSLEEPAGVRR